MKRESLLFHVNIDNSRLHRRGDLRRVWSGAGNRSVHQLLVLWTGASLWRMRRQHQEDTGAERGQDQAHSAVGRCISACWICRVSRRIYTVAPRDGR